MNTLFDNLENKIFLGKYRTEKLLGEGSFGRIYEDRYNGQNLLEFEANAIHSLKGFGIPSMKTFGYSGENNILVLELLGKSLENLFQDNTGKFSLKTVCMLAIQMLDRIQFIHSHNVIHRDIKPDNFLIGKNNYGEKIVYLIDFGLCKKFITKNNYHVKFSNNHKLTGTARYASINALKGFEQSRRDDIEAIGYVLMYFLRGILPWQGLKFHRKDDKFKKIYEVKKNTSTEELCRGYPEEFAAYLNYAKNLHFEETPDYNYLKNLFKNLMEKNEMIYDLEFDWIVNRKQKEQQNKEKLKKQQEGQLFQMIDLNLSKVNSKPQPIISKINLCNPIDNKKTSPPIFLNKTNNLENHETNKKEKNENNENNNDIKVSNPNKEQNTNKINLNSKSLVDMVKKENTPIENFDERLEKMLSKESIKDRNNKGAKDFTDNSKSNYMNSFYSLETREDLQTNVSSRYKLCSTSSTKIDYKTKYDSNRKIEEKLEEIPEVKEETYLAKTRKRVVNGARYVYDKCEIL